MNSLRKQTAASARRMGAAVAAVWMVGTLALHAQVNVLTYHNDNARTGQNTQETTLTPANVNINSFGKLFSVAVDGQVYAQPLYVSNVSIGGGTHNVVYAATEHDSVYAIDADTGTIYWHTSLIPAGGSTVSSSTDLNCGDITVEIGVTSTPVIDTSTGSLYVVAKYKLNGAIAQQLHALAISTGAEKFGGPTTIAATAPGNAVDGDGALVAFNPRQENQRAALLLENGHVIVAWTSHCDKTPWHGWVMSFNASTLTLEGAYNSSANGYGNGIWMSGGGPAADTAGNIFFATGNGSWNSTDLGNSVVRLGPPAAATLPVLDYFTPYNQAALTHVDYDLSSGGLILLPTLPNGKELTVILGKTGSMYLLDRTNLGKYCIDATPACTNSNPQIVQEVDDVFTGYWGTPAYWNGNLYFGGGNDFTGVDEPLKAYSFNVSSGLISNTPTSVSARNFPFSGPVPSISSNGNTNGIVWAIDDSRPRATCAAGATCQWLYAYDATNLNNLLYSSALVPNGRDSLGQPITFATPTIANGKVYVPSGGAVSAFGLLNATAPTATAPTLTPGGGTYTAAQSVTMADATPNAVVYYTLDGTTPTTASTKYAGAVPITASATVKAVATASGYTTSPVTTGTYVISTAPLPPGGSTPVNLTSADNVHGIFNNGVAPADGGFDTHGYALSATEVGTTVTWSGVTFDLGSAGAASAVSENTITLPAGKYSSLNLLAAAVNGNQPAQQFIVKYTDGTTTTFTQSVSDWFTPQNYAGESRALTMSYVLTPTGAERPGPYYLYGYTFALNAAKTVASLTLPYNRHVVVVATTLTGAAAAANVPVNLTGSANVYGMANNGVAVSNGGLDTNDYAASKTLLGNAQVWSGSTFYLGPAAAVDAASSVKVPLTAGQFATLRLLATAVNGSQAAQPFVVTYTDGTTTTFTQGVSDWFMPQNYPGEAKAVTMSYILTPTGAERAGPYYLYGYSFALNPAKTVKSLTLPTNRHVVLLAGELIAQ